MRVATISVSSSGPLAIEKLVALKDDATLQSNLAAVRRTNKAALARLITERLGIIVNPDALFVQQWGFKRGGLSEAEYERLLNEKVRPVFDDLKRRASEITERKSLTLRIKT